MIDFGFYNMDCMEGMKQIADKSIDLICTDPPYNIGIAAWDKVPNYIEWCGKWIRECERVLKHNGSFYFWHNDMGQLPTIMEWIKINTGFVFNSFIVWDKGEFRAVSWKNPTEENPLRSWFNTCEFCVFYTLQQVDGGSKYKNHIVYPIRDYIRGAIIKKDGEINLKKINGLLKTATNGGGVASAVLSTEKASPNMITQEHYETLQEHYETLQEHYETLRYTHNLEPDHRNVWRSRAKPNDGKLHECEKPIDLLSRIIRCSSKPGDIVLDLFAGSASTLIAAHNLQRKYIGFELDKGYYDAAKARLEREKAQISMFEGPNQKEEV